MTYLKTLIFLLVVLSVYACNKEENGPSEQLIETVTDVDGNEYQTIKIGEQIWMAENLKVTKLNDGSSISAYDFDPDNDDWFWNGKTTPMYVFPDNSDLNNIHEEELSEDHFGLLYSHAAIASGKLAPTGWRIPTLADFEKLVNSLQSSGHTDAGKALKSTQGWTANKNGTDAVGFNALPNGYCTVVGSATGAQAISTFMADDYADEKRMTISILDDVSMQYGDFRFGGAIRCIKE